MRSPRLGRVTIAAGMMLWLVACGGGDGGGGGSGTSTGGTMPGPTAPTGPTSSQPNTVLATPANAFEPGSVTVTRGATVTFTFQSVGHNVFFDTQAGAPANIPDVLSNASVTRTFATNGSFGYECHVHPGMRGTVVVQ